MNTIIIKNLIWQVLLPLWAIIGLFGFYYFLKLYKLFKKLEKEACDKDLAQFIKDNPGHPLVQEMYVLHRKSLITFFWMTGIIFFSFLMGVF